MIDKNVEVNQAAQFQSTKCKDILFCARMTSEEKEEEIAENIDVTCIGD